MKTTRKGSRDGRLKRDIYEQLTCSRCGESLKKRNDPDEVFSVRIYVDCGREQKELR